jgi:hypothetical protein
MSAKSRRKRKTKTPSLFASARSPSKRFCARGRHHKRQSGGTPRRCARRQRHTIAHDTIVNVALTSHPSLANLVSNAVNCSSPTRPPTTTWPPPLRRGSLVFGARAAGRRLSSLCHARSPLNSSTKRSTHTQSTSNSLFRFESSLLFDCKTRASSKIRSVVRPPLSTCLVCSSFMSRKARSNTTIDANATTIIGQP